jgi:hypothetical protein
LERVSNVPEQLAIKTVDEMNFSKFPSLCRYSLLDVEDL